MCVLLNADWLNQGHGPVQVLEAGIDQILDSQGVAYHRNRLDHGYGLCVFANAERGTNTWRAGLGDTVVRPECLSYCGTDVRPSARC